MSSDKAHDKEEASEARALTSHATGDMERQRMGAEHEVTRTPLGVFLWVGRVGPSLTIPVECVHLDLLNNVGRGPPSSDDGSAPRPTRQPAYRKARSNPLPRLEAAAAPRRPQPSPKGKQHKKKEEEEEEEPDVWWHEREMMHLPPKRPHKPTLLGLESKMQQRAEQEGRQAKTQGRVSEKKTPPKPSRVKLESSPAPVLPFVLSGEHPSVELQGAVTGGGLATVWWAKCDTRTQGLYLVLTLDHGRLSPNVRAGLNSLLTRRDRVMVMFVSAEAQGEEEQGKGGQQRVHVVESFGVVEASSLLHWDAHAQHIMHLCREAEREGSGCHRPVASAMAMAHLLKDVYRV